MLEVNNQSHLRVQTNHQLLSEFNLKLNRSIPRIGAVDQSQKNPRNPKWRSMVSLVFVHKSVQKGLFCRPLPYIKYIKNPKHPKKQIPQCGFRIGKIGFLEWDHHHQGYVVLHHSLMAGRKYWSWTSSCIRKSCSALPDTMLQMALHEPNV